MKNNQSYWLLIILSISGFVTSFGAHIVATNMPAYAEIVGAGAFTVGLLISIYDFAELFAKPISGVLADKKGMKISLLSGLSIFILGSLSFIFLPVRYLLLIRFAQGIGAAALSTVSISLVAKYYQKRQGFAFGIYNAIKGLGYVVSPAIGGYIVSKHSFKDIFYVSAFVGCVALLLSFFIPKDHFSSEDDDDDDLSLKEFFSLFKDRQMMPLYFIIFTNMFLVSILFGFLPMYLHSIHIPFSKAGMIISAATLSYIVIQPISGFIADKTSLKNALFIGIFLSATSILTVPFLTGNALWGVAIIAGVGVGVVWTNADAWMGSMKHDSGIGMRMGAAQSIKELGDMIGPITIGGLTHYLGIKAGFIICGVISLVGLFLLNLTFRNINFSRN